MVHSYLCPCGQPIELADYFAAREVFCPSCGMTVNLPPRLLPAPQPPWRDDDSEEPAPSCGEARSSLILGILSLVGGLIFGVPAIICGVRAKKAIARSEGRARGGGRATAGICMGVLSLLTTAVLVELIWSAAIKIQEESRRTQSEKNLKQLALSVIKSADDNDGRILPDAAIVSRDGRRLLSWRVAILQYLEPQLFREFHRDEPWDSEHNRQLISRMPKVFAHPGFPDDAAQGLTYYRALIGRETAFVPGNRFPSGISDGASQTIMLVEAEDPVPWTKPDELVYDPKGALPRFSTRRKSGFQAAMWNGSVLTVQPGMSEIRLRAACTANGNDPPGEGDSDW